VESNRAVTWHRAHWHLAVNVAEILIRRFDEGNVEIFCATCRRIVFNGSPIVAKTIGIKFSDFLALILEAHDNQLGCKGTHRK